MSITWSIIGEG